MAELLQPFVCDVCGVMKKEGNHWFRIWFERVNPHNPACMCHECQTGTGTPAAICIVTWNTMGPAKHFHACGEQHAIQKAAELLSQIGKSAGGTNSSTATETSTKP